MGKKAKTTYLWIDQYGNKEWARTQRELRDRCGGGRISPMYCDRKDGRTVRRGVVVGQRWFTQYAPVETVL